MQVFMYCAMLIFVLIKQRPSDNTELFRFACALCMLALLSPLLQRLTECHVSQVAGTEQGITEPEATFSACFGGAFLLWHPMKYASMLAEKMDEHGTNAWLVNTGWTGGRCAFALLLPRHAVQCTTSA